MQYSELSKPTYKLQEKENKRHHKYFKIKLKEGFSLRQLETYLKESYDAIMDKSWANPGQLRTELKKYFDPYDIKKFLKNYDFDKKKRIDSPDYIPISRSALGDMSVEGCWVLREKDFDKDEAEDDLRDFISQRRLSKREDFPKKQRIKGLILDKIINSEMLTLSQINQGTQAYVNLDENDDKDLGIDKQKYEVDLQGDIKSENEFKNPLDVRMDEFQKQIREGVPRKRLEDELEDKGIL